MELASLPCLQWGSYGSAFVSQPVTNKQEKRNGKNIVIAIQQYLSNILSGVININLSTHCHKFVN